MHTLFERTKLTPQSVAKKSGFLDWNTQPSRFKHYPHFCFSYDRHALGEHAWLLNLRHVTDKRAIGGLPYERLNTPSAGNLHPIELYVQVRKLKGVISGIYHIDVQNDKLVLIREIERDGLELHVGLKSRFVGVLLLTSIVPFRSFWKYGTRAWRYCFLDAGHQMATTLSYLERDSVTILSDYDHNALNSVMGFEDKEFTCSVLAIGEMSERKVEMLHQPLMHVLPCDYHESCDVIKAHVAQIVDLKSTYSAMQQWPKIEQSATLLQTRRSAREFAPEPLKKADVERFMNFIGSNGMLHVTPLVLRSEGFAQCENPDTVVKLLLSQRFIASATLVLCIHTSNPSPKAHIEAGMIAHWCYMLAESAGVGCSGIGAYYDDMLRAFIDTNDEIVYVVALGANV